MKKKSTPASRTRRPATQVLAPWTFLTNHAHVLWCLYREPESRLREVASQVGITERMVQRIVLDLASAGYLSVEKEGRRNRYRFHVDRPLRHPLESHCQVGQMLALLERAWR
jgi:hypothetical protein